MPWAVHNAGSLNCLQHSLIRKFRLPQQLYQNLRTLEALPGVESLARINHGIEKESLRVDASGHLAMTPHPAGLGSTLSHACITTDFSEALMEFITPVFTSPSESLACLEDIHAWTYTQLQPEELLWTSSMPCILGEDADIPLAQYGKSNIGQLKTLYRKGLGYRYGRTMQTIAGIHYNFSLSDEFWALYRDMLAPGQELQDFKTIHYFALIRNFRRYSWLLIYLFGASPAICKSFVRNNQAHGLQDYDDYSLYLPHATSLRMGDLGYTSKAQSGLHISYNSLEEYANGLLNAIKTPYPPYSHFRSEDGSPTQLNDSILQIENEFYGTIRPKRVSTSGIRPVRVLQEEGVQYIEVRCLDLNPFLPVGIDEEQMRFLNCFLIFCLLRQSLPMGREEEEECDANLSSVVKRGREPGLQLQRNGSMAGLQDWASEILGEAKDIALLLDRISNNTLHATATATQQAKVLDPALTPSAKVLQRMREVKTGFFQFAMNQSLANSDYFRSRHLSDATLSRFRTMSAESLQQQQSIEESDKLDFATFLRNVNNS
jgi:glutamate--cysteine ligase